MANPHPRKALALDTNIIVDLGVGASYAHAFREALQRKGYSLFVPPTAFREIAHIAIAERGEKSEWGHRALASLHDWRITLLQPQAINRDIVESLARRLIEEELIDPAEWNDGKIIGETALAEIPFLASNDTHLTRIDEVELHMVLAEADLSAVTVVNPRRFLSLLGK